MYEWKCRSDVGKHMDYIILLCVLWFSVCDLFSCATLLASHTVISLNNYDEQSGLYSVMMMADSLAVGDLGRLWVVSRTPVGGCTVRFLLNRSCCPLDRRRFGLTMIGKLLALSTSCVFPLRCYMPLCLELTTSIFCSDNFVCGWSVHSVQFTTLCPRVQVSITKVIAAVVKQISSSLTPKGLRCVWKRKVLIVQDYQLNPYYFRAWRKNNNRWRLWLYSFACKILFV